MVTIPPDVIERAETDEVAPDVGEDVAI